MLARAITKGVQVTAESMYQEAHSDPGSAHYLFSYRITIENHSRDTIRLLSRYWFIYDSLGDCHEVSGDGVVGRQPLLKPGESYQYTSACPITNIFGYMHGHYVMQKSKDESLFKVDIPTFLLEVPWILN